MTNCPICGQTNNCGNLSADTEPCWCTQENFPEKLFALVPPELLNKSCICKACLDRHNRQEVSSSEA
ncbi:cysteine-rich CWC family protein [Cohnella kolymensis]|uniref:cysteine-rich CWC family protein n=1 Tax=Cohnella kolymensis TaxID=1590652 RepID=UPI0009E65A44|nr:cysteine-rich CWC family protein [Cohnella kolymensis]